MQFLRAINKPEIYSLPVLLLMWQLSSMFAASRFWPSPIAVGSEVFALAEHGSLYADFAKTLSRAAQSFVYAMALGISLGVILGRIRYLDRLLNLWVVVGLNIPAIVVAILCYIWLGLTEFALILAVVINKFPLVTTIIREGTRNLSWELDELSGVFRLGYWRKFRWIWLPQLLPYILTSARTGMSLIWKIVLVFEILGSDGGVGFQVSVFFQFFDITGVLAYTVVFIFIVLAIEYGILRPAELYLQRWRTAE